MPFIPAPEPNTPDPTGENEPSPSGDAASAPAVAHDQGPIEVVFGPIPVPQPPPKMTRIPAELWGSIMELQVYVPGPDGAIRVSVASIEASEDGVLRVDLDLHRV